MSHTVSSRGRQQNFSEQKPFFLPVRSFFLADFVSFLPGLVTPDARRREETVHGYARKTSFSAQNKTIKRQLRAACIEQENAQVICPVADGP